MRPSASAQSLGDGWEHAHESAIDDAVRLANVRPDSSDSDGDQHNRSDTSFISVDLHDVDADGQLELMVLDRGAYDGAGALYVGEVAP